MAPDQSQSHDRILAAAYAVFEGQGLNAGTMSEVSRVAAVGRATLYRHFPSKETLVGALVLREARELFGLLDHELEADEDDPRALLERGMITALEYLRSHSLLQRMLRDEPESILPYLTVRGTPLLEAAVEFVTPYIERAVKAERIPPVHPRAAAEWAARILLSLVLTPSVVVDLDDPKQVSAFIGWLAQAIGQTGEQK